MKYGRLVNATDGRLMFKCVKRSSGHRWKVEEPLLSEQDKRFYSEHFEAIQIGCGYEVIVEPNGVVENIETFTGGGWNYYECPECGCYLATFIQQPSGRWKLKSFSAHTGAWSSEGEKRT